MSKKILISLGSIAFLGTAAYSLSLLNYSSENIDIFKDLEIDQEEKIFPNIQQDEFETPKPVQQYHNYSGARDAPIWEEGDKRPFDEYRGEGFDYSKLKEAWKKAQPIRFAWQENRNNQETHPFSGMEAIYLIRDYTFRFLNPCLGGTFWILDYEIPEDNKYPTKYFFGTNAHVIQGIKFKDDPYKQEAIPSDKCQTNGGMIIRETNLRAGGINDFAPERWDPKYVGSFGVRSNYNVKDWLNKDYEPLYYYYEFQNPKLVYLATDFAGHGQNKWGDLKYQSEKYMTDFAVIEIDFETEEIARKMTRDFHDKYHYKTGTHKDSAIDFFTEPLMERKTNKELYEESPDFYVAGYPNNGLYGRSVGSYDITKRQASKLTYFSTEKMIRDKNGDDIIGHSNIQSLSIYLDGFGEKRRFFRGVSLLLEHERLRGGSSGSLTTDGNRRAIGVKSRRSGEVAEIDLFRSPAITYKGKTIIPKYDLLEGVPEDKDSRSYKSSILPYLLRENKKTHLSEMRGWKNKQTINE